MSTPSEFKEGDKVRLIKVMEYDTSHEVGDVFEIEYKYDDVDETKEEAIYSAISVTSESSAELSPSYIERVTGGYYKKVVANITVSLEGEMWIDPDKTLDNNLLDQAFDLLSENNSMQIEECEVLNFH